jgi:hypothetical protein
MRYMGDKGELNQECNGLNAFVIGREVKTLTGEFSIEDCDWEGGLLEARSLNDLGLKAVVVRTEMNANCE